MYEVFAGGVEHPKAWYHALKEVVRADLVRQTPEVDFGKLLEGFRSAVDSPASDCYIELSKAYPKAKVYVEYRSSSALWTS